MIAAFICGFAAGMLTLMLVAYVAGIMDEMEGIGDEYEL